jgi:NADP-dependent 3-hydroxy acid dehydrogenase YdfG
MARLAGKIAWVTGAGSGIGEAAALALAAEGAELVLSGRREAPLEAVAARIMAAGGQAHVQPGDMGDSEAARAVGAAIAARFGRLHILVNNAGLNITERRWAALTHAGAEELLRGNLASAFHTVIAALPRLCAARSRRSQPLPERTGPRSGPLRTGARSGRARALL